MNRRKSTILRVASQHLLKALLTSLDRGEKAGGREDLTFGDSLDRLPDEANADLLEASRYLDALMEVVILDPHKGPHLARALKGLATHLDDALTSLGRYRGNSMSRMASGEEEDWAKSLNSLVRSNQGLWKSERQAKYLVKRLKSHHKKLVRGRSPAIKWAKRYKWFDIDSMIVFAHVSHLSQFGHKERSKIRYAAWFYVIDEYGVKAKARAEYAHAKGGGDFKGLTGKAKLEFKRRARVTGDVRVPISGVESAEEAWDRMHEERQKNIAKNKKMIDALKSHPEYDDKYILQSFVEQLEEGRTLSPKQMYIVNKMLDTDMDLGVGMKNDWSSWWQELLQLYVSKLVPNMIKSPIFDEVADADHREELREGSIEYLEKGIKPGSMTGYPLWAMSEVESVLSTLAPRVRSIRQQQGLVEMSQQVQRSLKRKKPTKKALGYLRDLKDLVKALRDASPQAIANAVR